MKNRNRIMERKIYIFLFRENCFYIGSTIQSLRDVFKSNKAGRNGWTIQYFQEAEPMGQLPKIFLLDEITCNQYKSFRRQIAWSKLLIESDYICVNGDKFMQHVESVSEDDIDYAEIKNTDLEVLLLEDKSPNYGRERKTNPNGKQLNIPLTMEEHHYIVTKSKECNMTQKDYVKQLILNPNIILLDTSSLAEYITELRRGIAALQQITLNIYFMQQYFPEDLKKIQEFTDMVNEHYRTMVKLSIDMSKRIIKSRKIKIPQNHSPANHRA